MGYILSIDQSTSGTKGLIWNRQGALVGRCDIPHRQITNDKGWVEHDPEEIYRNALTAAEAAIKEAGVKPENIEVAGISNQRETAICWDKFTGLPVYKAIVWQCGRAASITEEMAAQGLGDLVKTKTGLNLSPFFSAAKFSWIVKNVPAAAEAVKNGSLCCGTVDAWLIYKLTGELKTDYSNASRTELLNLDTLTWDEDLISVFGLKEACLPEICDSDSLFGYSDFGGLFPKGVPIHSVMGDSHAALFANNCTKQHMAKTTYGTGSSIMVNVGAQRPERAEGVVTSLAWGRNGEVVYVLEGNINYTGAVIKWLADNIGIIAESSEAGDVASSVTSNGGVYLVPAFSGLGAPYFSNNSRAIICGMSKATTRSHIVRAAEECVAYQIHDVVKAMNRSSDCPLSSIKADGGPTRDRFLMQFQADILGIPVEISSLEALSGAGAAYCAALGAGIASEKEIFSSIRYRIIEPQMDSAQREKLLAGWNDAVRMIIKI
ncbi:MAG: glycerol kinase GlpK [Oscillospiraceae bacterium]|jgi:glycerol kinase|nr:glycerol kinase GlpK [Oscillospiraceae bacterium]